MKQSKTIRYNHENTAIFTETTRRESLPVHLRNSKTFQDSDIFGSYKLLLIQNIFNNYR